MIPDRLFSQARQRALYGILDGASMPELRGRLVGGSAEHACLLGGELDPDLAQAAPYLVHLERDSEISDWVIAESWGNHRGIFAVSQAPFRILKRHFRALLYVYDPENLPRLFRYYDPRVLRPYLPTCTPEECRQIFGPVDRYLLESDGGADLLMGECGPGKFSWRSGGTPAIPNPPF